MKNQTISSDEAAQQCQAGATWPDNWVTGRVVMQHFGFCERTLRTFVKHNMPKHLIGRKRMRFVLHEVYDWLVREGALRFAAIGLANTLREDCPKCASAPAGVSFTVPVGLAVSHSPPPPSDISPPASFDQAVAAIVAELKALRKAQQRPTPKSLIAPPQCKPGRKPKHPGATICAAL